jgi:hypothetical protein
MYSESERMVKEKYDSLFRKAECISLVLIAPSYSEEERVKKYLDFYVHFTGCLQPSVHIRNRW